MRAIVHDYPDLVSMECPTSVFGPSFSTGSADSFSVPTAAKLGAHTDVNAFAVALRHTLAQGIPETQVQLAKSIALLRRFSIPIHCFAVA